MKDKEFEDLNKEVKHWNEFRNKIHDEANIISKDNYEVESIVFRILGIKYKKDKDKFIKIMEGAQENIFSSTFSVMYDYFENTLKKDYAFIEDSKIYKKMSKVLDNKNNEGLKRTREHEREIKKIKKQIVNCKDYDEIQNLKYLLWKEEDYIKEEVIRAGIINDLRKELKDEINKTSESK